MLNLNKISGNMISGIDSNELSFLELLTSNIDDDTLINQFTGLPESIELFDDVNINDIPDDQYLKDLEPDVILDLNQLEKNNSNKNTASQTQYYVDKFKLFLTSQKLPETIETMPVRYLSQYLRLWYAKSTKCNGEPFSPSTLVCMRAAIQRYLNSSDVNQNVNIIDGEDFKLANNTLKAVIAKYLKSKKGCEDSSNLVAIDRDDLKLLSVYFTRSTPLILQQEVFYLFIYHFGYRGREWLRDITKDSIKVATDSHGREYVEVVKGHAEKNVKPSTSRRHYESIKNIFMYATPEAADKCPVQAVKLYLSKIPEHSNCLFPKSLIFSNKTNLSSPVWYSDKLVLGKNILNDFMKRISSDAKLSRVYTNHCIRSTVVSELHGKGYSVTDIQTVTGHKRPESVLRYIKRTTPAKKQKISNDLSLSLHNGSELDSQSTATDVSETQAIIVPTPVVPTQRNHVQIENKTMAISNSGVPSAFANCTFSNVSFANCTFAYE